MRLRTTGHGISGWLCDFNYSFDFQTKLSKLFHQPYSPSTVHSLTSKTEIHMSIIIVFLSLSVLTNKTINE